MNHKALLACLSAGALVLAVLSIRFAPRQDRPRTAQDAQARGERAEEGEKIPNEYFHVQRSYPQSDIPMDAYRAALDQAMAHRAALRGGDAAAFGGAWEAAGPTNIGGRITAVAIHPSVPDRIFAGAAMGGVLRSNDGGSSWTPLTDDGPSLSIGALAIDPEDPDHVYAGTGEANTSGDSYPGTGVYVSTDAGETWSWSGLPDSRHIGRLAISPQNSDLIFAAVMGGLFTTGPDRGLYRSQDGGNSWEQVLFVSDSTGCADVVVHPGDAGVVYAAFWERLRAPDFRYVGGVTSGIYKSTDGGDSWSLLSSGLPAPAQDVGRIGLAISESNPSVLYAIYADDPGFFMGLYKTTNGGAAWSQTNDTALADLFSSFGWYFGNVRVDPQNENRVFAMGLDIYRSTNGGGSWSDISGFDVHVDQHDLWISPTNSNWMLAGHDGGLDRTTNGGSSWTKFDDLPITQFYAATVDHQLPWRLYGGTQDNSTMRTLTGDLDDYEIILGGDGFYTLVDPTDSDVIYAEYQYGNLYKSVDGGNDFFAATNGISGGDRRNWSTPVVMDPSDNETLYYGTYRVYRTTNGASSWSSISPDLSNGPGSGNLTFGTLTTIAVAPADPDVVYAGLDDGNVWVTTNGGGNWTKISGELPERWITRVAVDPSDAATAYVTLSGYREDLHLPHVFRTTNSGASWTDISGDLPEAPINAVVVDPDVAGTLYVGTDLGVYATHDGGAAWSVLGAGLPLVTIHDLVLHNPTRTLVAGTHGRSLFRLDLSAVSTPETDLAAGLPGLRLERPSPNPFGDRTVLRYTLAAAERVGAAVYDVAGREIHRWPNAEQGPGNHTLAWDGRDGSGARAASGVYWIRVEAGAKVGTARVLLEE